VQQQASTLDFARLAPEGEAVSEIPLPIQSPLSVGLFAGKWCSYSAPPDLPHDQREEDGGALVFDTDFLQEDLEILGAPVLELEFESNRPVAMLAVRLSDVQPDNRATRVTYGLLNLTHRDSDENPEELEPGKRYRVQVQLNHIAQRFPKGHWLRLSLSTSYWPLAWPPPEPVKLQVYTGRSRLVLPKRPPRAEDERLPAFHPPEAGPPVPKTLIQPTQESWTVIRDLALDESRLEVLQDEGHYRLDDIDLEVHGRAFERYSYRADEYESLRGETQWTRYFKRGDWEIRTVTRTVLTSSSTEFRIRADLDAYEGDSRVYSQSWDSRIPRDHV
jgi:hypothetical protein